MAEVAAGLRGAVVRAPERFSRRIFMALDAQAPPLLPLAGALRVDRRIACRRGVMISGRIISGGGRCARSGLAGDDAL